MSKHDKTVAFDTPVRIRSEAYRESLHEALLAKGYADGYILQGIFPQYKGWLWRKKFIGYIAVIEYEQPNPFFYYRTGSGKTPNEALQAAINAL